MTVALVTSAYIYSPSSIIQLNLFSRMVTRFCCPFRCALARAFNRDLLALVFNSLCNKGNNPIGFLTTLSTYIYLLDSVDSYVQSRSLCSFIFLGILPFIRYFICPPQVHYPTFLQIVFHLPSLYLTNIFL